MISLPNMVSRKLRRRNSPRSGARLTELFRADMMTEKGDDEQEENPR
jgi:hypothetical protein